MKNSKILVIDDEVSICSLVTDILLDEGYEVKYAHNCKDADALRVSFVPDLILLDVWLPDGDGISLLKKWKSDLNSYQDIIMMSGHANIETAVSATQLGAYNFLEKPLELSDLTITVRRALEYLQLKKENQALRSKTNIFLEPVGSSDQINMLRNQCKKLSQYDVPVMMMGETGSGRHTFARFLHQHSGRQKFIHLNASLLSVENFESELYGCIDENEHFLEGKLSDSKGATLLLDDLDTMSLDVQDMFLDMLKNGFFKHPQKLERLPIDFQIISITRPVIHELVSGNQFRSDLFYHLNVLPLEIPPLLEHMQDVKELVDYYLDFFHEKEGMPKLKLEKKAMECLLHYAWPGNVLELKNFVQRLIILQKGQVTPNLISNMLRINLEEPSNDKNFNWHQGFKDARREFERLYFQYHLKSNDFNVTQVARITGIERSSLHRKIKDLNLESS